jgi:hypothetical protein
VPKTVQLFKKDTPIPKLKPADEACGVPVSRTEND